MSNLRRSAYPDLAYIQARTCILVDPAGRKLGFSDMAEPITFIVLDGHPFAFNVTTPKHDPRIAITRKTT